jgi:hypothetical protein
MVRYQTPLRSLSAASTAALPCPPVTHQVPNRPMHSISRNRKTRSISLWGTLSEIRLTGCETPAKKVAEFHLATHPEKEKTLYYRIRAFDKQAERVRDTVRKGQTEVEVFAYGPKYWPVTRRTKDGEIQQEVVQGYYAGFVKVPKRYRDEQPPPHQARE